MIDALVAGRRVVCGDSFEPWSRADRRAGSTRVHVIPGWLSGISTPSAVVLQTTVSLSRDTTRLTTVGATPRTVAPRANEPPYRSAAWRTRRADLKSDPQR
jgi:hypothetical protein